MPPIQKILVPTDFSPHAAEAFRVAHDLARATGAVVVVQHVARPPAVVSDGARPLSTPADREEDVWDKLRTIRSTDPAVRVEHEVIVADRPDVSHVLKMVEAAGCDLIVMGTHGLTGLKHRIFGGLTEQVVRLARCPVMVVKAPAPEGMPPGPEAVPEAQAPATQGMAPGPEAIPQAVGSGPDPVASGEYLG